MKLLRKDYPLLSNLFLDVAKGLLLAIFLGQTFTFPATAALKFLATVIVSLLAVVLTLLSLSLNRRMKYDT